jgi:HSP20 family protein
MTLYRHQPWGLLNQLNREINRMLETPEQRCNQEETTGPYAFSPPVDIAEYGQYYLLKIDLPGVDLASVDIGMDRGVLTLRGERARDIVPEGASYHRNERVTGKFFRRFSLPDTVDAERISAKGNHGVLEITIPKLEKVAPRKISVEIAH